jgi:hypothetical protein
LTGPRAFGTPDLVRRALFVTLVVSLSAMGETELGAQLPDGARKVAERRYKAPSDFEGTLKYYKNVYPASSHPRKEIVHQPGIRAVHIPNTSGKGGWEGLNIYEANDEVRIYVVPAAKSDKRPPAKK